MYQHRLRDLREDRDLKQKDLAGILRIHQTTYSDYELDRLNIPVQALHTLACLETFFKWEHNIPVETEAH